MFLGTTGAAHAITYSFTIIEVPGFEGATDASGINNAGQILGHVPGMGYRKDGDSFTFFPGESLTGIRPKPNT
jgi:hypothetical protein